MINKVLKNPNEKEKFYKYICPYNKDHLLCETQIDRHLNQCPNKPKTVKNNIN